MSKKPDVKKNRDKGNKVSAAVTREKPQKPRGPKPASYAPKQKAVTEAPRTDPAIIWNGWNGVVEIQGMRFRSSRERIGDGTREVLKVSVLFAPAGTELYGLAGSKILVTVPQLHRPFFRSIFKEGSVDCKRQERLWNFLNKIFLELGMKQPPVVRQNPRPSMSNTQARQTSKVSGSIDDLASGVSGMYSFEDVGQPQAHFQVKTMKYTNHKTHEEKTALIVEAVTIDYGHKLYDSVRTKPRKPFVFHNQLSWERVPNFNGACAGASEKIWEFLTELIAKHRKDVLGGETGIVNPEDFILGEGKVIYLADHQKAA